MEEGGARAEPVQVIIKRFDQDVMSQDVTLQDVMSHLP